MKIIPKFECSFDKWQHLFKKISLNSILVEIPEHVFLYLLADGIVLPEEATFETNSEESLDSYSSYSNEGWEETEVEAPSFLEFSDKIKEVIESLGGHAFIKGNWRAPSDAAWITPSKTLKCSNLEDVYLLLKSSNKITDDLLYLQKAQAKLRSYPKAYLVLKEWIDIESGTEFRCFVANNKLIAISQRDSEFHSHMGISKIDIINNMHIFFNNELKDKFTLQDYVFDVVRTTHGIILLDFGEFCGEESKPYLFSWDELVEMKNTSQTIDVEFRYIAESFGIQPNFECHGLPHDLTVLYDQFQGMSLMDIVQLEVQKQ